MSVLLFSSSGYGSRTSEKKYLDTLTSPAAAKSGFGMCSRLDSGWVRLPPSGQTYPIPSFPGSGDGMQYRWIV
jgi:hypothetical protein